MEDFDRFELILDRDMAYISAHSIHFYYQLCLARYYYEILQLT